MITPSQKTLTASQLDTPLGTMIAVADEKALYLLEFVDSRNLKREIERLQKKTKASIVSGKNDPIEMIEDELKKYFAGTLTEFKTPLHMQGSPFQKRVWEELRKTPYGATRSYSSIAVAIGKPTAFRAVAQAHGSNQLCLIIPCHRVIKANGDLCGYNAGIERKKWLISHEKSR